MTISTQEKRSNFARIFPPRIEGLIDQFRKVANCASRNYDYDTETVSKVWVHVLMSVKTTAKEFGLHVDFTINGMTMDQLYQEGSIKEIVDKNLSIN